MFVPLCVLLVALTSGVSAEVHGLLVPPRHPVYDLLERAATLGAVERAAIWSRPMRQSDVVRLLTTVDSARLSNADRARVEWYLDEFATPVEGRLIGADGGHAEYSDGRSFMRVGPSVRFDASYFEGGDARLWREYGIEGAGRVGDWLYVHGTAHSAAQMGDRLGPPDANSPDRGLSGWTVNADASEYYFDTSEGYVGAAWSNGGVWLGRFAQSWGPGVRGQLFLSDHAPSMPQVMIVLQPWGWFTYRFLHTQLESGIVDTTTIIRPSERERFSRYYGKYLAAHRFDIWPIPQLRFALNQSVVYGASGIDFGYLSPMVDLRYIQHSKGDRDNVQLGFDFTLFWPRYTAISGALFIDELRIATMFDDAKSRNWVAAQIGVRVEDLWGALPRSTVLLEYARLNPWVYEHRYPWSTFASAGIGVGSRVGPIQYPLGHWMGQHSDGLYAEVRYDIGKRHGVSVSAERIRQGIPAVVSEQPYDGANYRATPFLSGPVTTTWRSEIAWTWLGWRHVVSEAAVGWTDVNGPVEDTSELSARVGIRWNAW